MEDSSSCSSVASGVAQASFLQRTLGRLSSTQRLTLSGDEAAPVAVAALQRYLSEQEEGRRHLSEQEEGRPHLSEQAEGRQLESYSYDLTVTDGLWRAKCLLHPGLNHLVRKNTLKTGSDIFITQCSFVYNETRLGHGYICIEKVDCSSRRSSVLRDINDVLSLPMLVKPGMERSVLLHSDVPLQVSRKHYLSLWNNDDPEGNMWTSGCPSPDTVLDVSKVALLSSLESSFRATWKPLPLLVKIIHKSRLRYYGKFGLNIHYPYQAYFEVADQSGTMSLVLWNELCPEFYQRLNVGTVLYLQNYTLKQSYSNRSRPQMDHHRMKNFTSVEICLNPRKPASVITVVPPKSVLPQWGLPEVSYHFITRSELATLADNSACDVIGLVTFVGRVERVRSKGTKGPEKYWTYRWVHVIDGTSEQPFILELFSSSQPEIFSHICPMTYLVCTQMRVCQVEGSLPYLTSSCETESFITGHHKGQPYVSDPRVKSFIQWTKTLKDNVILLKTALGGHYSYPHPPQTFTQSPANPSGQVPLVSVADLRRELETMQYREHKKLAIQGQITAVLYTTNPKLQGTEEGEVMHIVFKTSFQGLVNNQLQTLTVVPQRLSQMRPTVQCLPPLMTQPAEGKEFKRLGQKTTEEGEEQEETESASKEGHHKENNLIQSPSGGDSDALSWKSSSWSKQREDLSEHLCQGGLYQDSISRRFTFDEKSVLLQWSNLQPTRWTSAQATETITSALCPGYYQLTILGVNKQIAVDAAFFPVLRSDEPQAVGLPQHPHDNTMLSCLTSGFLWPLSGAADHRRAVHPDPEQILASASELEDMHVVCILDLCHLGDDKVEILVNKVYRVTEASLD
ncbi:RPA-related protein RADX [Xenentodon cancila]